MNETLKKINFTFDAETNIMALNREGTIPDVAYVFGLGIGKAVIDGFLKAPPETRGNWTLKDVFGAKEILGLQNLFAEGMLMALQNEEEGDAEVSS